MNIQDADEFSSSSEDYYFQEDSIQFIYAKSERLLDHWGADTVRYKILELRFYFNKGQIIKALKKEFIGIEGQGQKADFKTIESKVIHVKDDNDANWPYYQEKITDLIQLYNDLEKVF